jgi:hypothetical protein
LILLRIFLYSMRDYLNVLLCLMSWIELMASTINSMLPFRLLCGAS